MANSKKASNKNSIYKPKITTRITTKGPQDQEHAKSPFLAQDTSADVKIRPKSTTVISTKDSTGAIDQARKAVTKNGKSIKRNL